MARIAPSILSADFATLGSDVDKVASEADMLHVDVMDGHFVPNLTLGPPVVASLRKHTGLYLDCHLMMSNPGRLLPAFKEAGADACSVHVEIGATSALISQINELGLDAGLAVNPDTPFEAYEPYLEDIDWLLLMTVFPGFAGQKFIKEVVPKIEHTAEQIDKLGLELPIQVDGGIDEETGPITAKAGASIFVAGKAIFGNPNPGEAVRRLREAVEQ